MGGLYPAPSDRRPAFLTLALCARARVNRTFGGRFPRNRDTDAGTVAPMPDTTGRGSGGARGERTVPQAQHERERERRHKRAAFLRELDEAKELRDRVQPRRARAARMRQQMRMRTFRW